MIKWNGRESVVLPANLVILGKPYLSNTTAQGLAT